VVLPPGSSLKTLPTSDDMIACQNYFQVRASLVPPGILPVKKNARPEPRN
jgi:hypothetical protein